MTNTTRHDPAMTKRDDDAKPSADERRDPAELVTADLERVSGGALSWFLRPFTGCELAAEELAEVTGGALNAYFS